MQNARYPTTRDSNDFAARNRLWRCTDPRLDESDPIPDVGAHVGTVRRSRCEQRARGSTDPAALTKRRGGARGTRTGVAGRWGSRQDRSRAGKLVLRPGMGDPRRECAQGQRRLGPVEVGHETSRRSKIPRRNLRYRYLSAPAVRHGARTGNRRGCAVRRCAHSRSARRPARARPRPCRPPTTARPRKKR